MITGSSGFLGKSLLESLRGLKPRAKILTLDRLPSPGRDHFQANLLDPASTKKALGRARAQVVFHLAGGTTQSWPELWRSHVLATARLLEAVISLPRRSRPRVVLAGSAHEYGSFGPLPLRESALPRPGSPYGWSKLCQTYAALAYACLGVDVVVARIFNVVGPGLPATHALSSFCRQIAQAEAGGDKEIIARGNLSAGRDFVDARDVCRALILLGSKGKPGEVYNVCSGRMTRIRSALDLLLRMARLRIRVRAGKGSALDAMRGSTAKLNAATGWRPAIPLRRSLEELLDEWRRRI